MRKPTSVPEKQVKMRVIYTDSQSILPSYEHLWENKQEKGCHTLNYEGGCIHYQLNHLSKGQQAGFWPYAFPTDQHMMRCPCTNPTPLQTDPWERTKCSIVFLTLGHICMCFHSLFKVSYINLVNERFSAHEERRRRRSTTQADSYSLAPSSPHGLLRYNISKSSTVN